MCSSGRLFGGALVTEAWASVAYVVVVCGGRYTVGICWDHEVCMVVVRGEVPFGSFRCSVVEGRSKVARRVSMEDRREFLLPGLSPFGRRAIMTLVGWMCSV